MSDEPDKVDEQRGAVSRPPTADSRLETYAPRPSVDADEFYRKMTERFPQLGPLLAEKSKEARAAILAQMDWNSRQATFGVLISIAFQFAKRSRQSEALELQRINYEIASTDPADRLESFLHHTQPRNLGDVMSAIGNTQMGTGDYSQALASLLEAEAHYQEDEKLRKQAGITKPSETDRLLQMDDFRSSNFVLISRVYKQLGDPKAADEYNLKAWQYSTRGANPQDRFESLIASANGANLRGDIDAALGMYWDARKLALSLPGSALTGEDVVASLSAMGRIYAGLGLYRKALELFERCRELDERASHLRRLLLDHTHIGEVHAARGDTDGAIASYRNALVCASRKITGDQLAGQKDLIFQDGNDSYQLVQLGSAWDILLAMARLERNGNRDAAMEHLVLAVDVVEHLRTRVVQEERRLGYQAPSMDVYDEFIDLLAEEYEETQNPDSLEKLFSTIERAKARVLYEMLADQPIAKPLRTPDQLIDQEMALLTEIEKLQAALEGSAGSSFEMINQFDSANEKLAEVWEKIALSDPAEGPEYVSLRKAEIVSCADIRATLRNSGNSRIAVANFYLAQKRLISVCLYSDKPELHYHSEPVDRDEVRRWALVNPEDPPSADLRLPYWVLDFPSITVAPIANAVAGYDVVCVALHDVLHSLPLHAFPASSNSQPLIMDATLSYVPSASILRFCLRRRKPNVGNSLVVGSPDRSDQIPIPHSAAEAQTIATLLNSEAITGAAATRVTVIEKGEKAEYLHLACHCKFYSQDPMSSALMLSDGDFTARDMFGWRLNPELVVLSACESGVSKVQAGDELIGLVRALLFAGTPTIIVSLWNAYDGSAADIMKDFYMGHIEEKKSMALALADAQRTQIRKGAGAAQWAPFVVVGDWR